MNGRVRFQATFIAVAIAATIGAVTIWEPGRTAAGPVAQQSAEESNLTQHAGSAVPPPGDVFKICTGQTYALCASARCNVFDDVAYCQCEIEQGDSISLPLQLSNGGDVCTVNAAGVGNGYMVSTFSLPQSIVAPSGNQAIYTCDGNHPQTGGKADGAYAQCDGGLCFTSTEGTTFFGQSVPQGQIICSCPITVASAAKKTSYQIVGPFPCQESFFQYCNSAIANRHNGSTIYVGAPPGSISILTEELTGSIPQFNECRRLP